MTVISCVGVWALANYSLSLPADVGSACCCRCSSFMAASTFSGLRKPLLWEHDGEDREVWRDLDRVKERYTGLLERHASSPDDVKQWLNVCVWYAAENGCKTVCRFLLEVGADPSWRASFYGTAIHRVALRNKPDILQLFLDKYHWCVNTTDFFGLTPLFWACYFGNRRCVEVLLSKGAQAHTGYFKTTSTVKLVFLNDDVTSHDSALAVATKRKHLQIVEMIEKQCCYADKGDSQMLHNEIVSLRFDTARELFSDMFSIRKELAQLRSELSSQRTVSAAEASNRHVENPDYKETLKELQKRYANRWYAIGKELGFSADELSRIDHMCIPHCDKLQVMFDQKVSAIGEAKALAMLRQACRSIYKPAEE